MSKSEHGNTGNNNASKDPKKRISGDKCFFPAPIGTKARIIKAANKNGFSTYGSWIRTVILEKLEEEENK